MKKFKCITVMSMIFISSVFMFSGCKKNLLMDEHKCAEVALEYMENKYKEEFEVLDSGEVGGVFGKSGYATVNLKNSSDETEKVYIVVVYPDTIDDKDDDGYYDSYKIISDTYMSYLIKGYVKNEMNKLLVDAGLTRYIIGVSIQEVREVKGFWGFGSDFPIQNEEKFSLTDIFNNYKISMHCWIEIPESEYSDILQNNITDVIRPLLRNDLVTFDIEIYINEHFDEVEENEKNNIERIVKGDKKIYFEVKENDK